MFKARSDGEVSGRESAGDVIVFANIFNKLSNNFDIILQLVIRKYRYMCLYTRDYGPRSEKTTEVSTAEVAEFIYSGFVLHSTQLCWRYDFTTAQ